MEIKQNVSLADHTTFKTGGFARLFCIVETREDLIEAIAFAKSNAIDFYILGGGSNILVSQNGFDGLIIKIHNQGVTFKESGDAVYVHVMAGVNWDVFVQEAVNHSLYGAENLSLIPGTVGAAPIQNMGAYGVEVMDIIDSVEVFNTDTGEFEILSNKECQFGYRDSIFKKDLGKKYIIFSVTFLLSKKQRLNTDYADIQNYFNDSKQEITLQSLRDAIVHIRTRKLPDLEKYGTAGSFFKNPVVKKDLLVNLQTNFPDIPVYDTSDPEYVKTSAAFLIDKVAGMKGLQINNVGTFENQALVIINFGSASGEEILSFATHIQQCVYEKSGILLEMEVQRVGF